MRATDAARENSKLLVLVGKASFLKVFSKYSIGYPAKAPNFRVLSGELCRSCGLTHNSSIEKARDFATW